MLDAAGGDLLYRFKSGNRFNQKEIPLQCILQGDFLFK